MIEGISAELLAGRGRMATWVDVVEGATATITCCSRPPGKAILLAAGSLWSSDILRFGQARRSKPMCSAAWRH